MGNSKNLQSEEFVYLLNSLDYEKITLVRSKNGHLIDQIYGQLYRYGEEYKVIPLKTNDISLFFRISELKYAWFLNGVVFKDGILSHSDKELANRYHSLFGTHAIIEIEQ